MPVETVRQIAGQVLLLHDPLRHGRATRIVQAEGDFETARRGVRFQNGVDVDRIAGFRDAGIHGGRDELHRERHGLIAIARGGGVRIQLARPVGRIDAHGERVRAAGRRIGQREIPLIGDALCGGEAGVRGRILRLADHHAIRVLKLQADPGVAGRGRGSQRDVDIEALGCDRAGLQRSDGRAGDLETCVRGGGQENADDQQIHDAFEHSILFGRSQPF